MSCSSMTQREACGDYTQALRLHRRESEAATDMRASCGNACRGLSVFRSRPRLFGQRLKSAPAGRASGTRRRHAPQTRTIRCVSRGFDTRKGIMYAGRKISGSATHRIGAAHQDRSTDPDCAAASHGSTTRARSVCAATRRTAHSRAGRSRPRDTARGCERIDSGQVCGKPIVHRRDQDAAASGLDAPGIVSR